jgi:channel protein (hemolysin III family)
MYEHAHLLSIPGFSDPVSSLTHLAGALVFGVLSISLIGRGRGEARRVFSLAVFAFSVVLLLSLSGVYHLLTHETAARSVLMRLDHAAIFVLIAGSFTPVHAILLRARWHRTLLSGIWLAALAGLTLKTVYFASLPSWLGLAMYLGLGWLGAISTIAIAHRFGWRFVLPLLWGALAYTIGALADQFDWPVPVSGIVGPHEIFHLAVLAGISFHWAFIRTIAPLSRGDPSFQDQRAAAAHAHARDGAVALLGNGHQAARAAHLHALTDVELEHGIGRGREVR